METVTKIKLGLGGVLATIIVVLWAFGGLIGALIAISNDDAWSTAFSLLIPCYGAIYTIVKIFAGIF
jgi:hypothetical protein